MISIDEIFEWTGGVNGWGKFLSKCRIRIIETPFRVVVVATELPDNGGASITNAVEHLALLVCRRWGSVLRS